MIDDAHMLTSEAISALNHIMFAGRGMPLPIQLVLAGLPQMWEDRLIGSGFASLGSATRVVLNRAEARPSCDFSALSKPTRSFGASEDGHLFEARSRPLLPAAQNGKPCVPGAAHTESGFPHSSGLSGKTAYVATWGAFAFGFLAIAASAVFGASSQRFEAKDRLTSQSRISAAAEDGSSDRNLRALLARGGELIESGDVANARVMQKRVVDLARTSTLTNPDLASFGKVLAGAPGLRSDSLPVVMLIPRDNERGQDPATSASSTSDSARVSQPGPPSYDNTTASLEMRGQALLDRGNQLLETGDIHAARLFYERAANENAAAALRAGLTYDPGFLMQIGARGIVPDPAIAATWYRRASALGDASAEMLLEQLGDTSH
jgi:hypothetical protein